MKDILSNGNYIECLELSKNQRLQPNNVPLISLGDFVEQVMDIRLLPYQKAYFKMFEYIPEGTKFMLARGQNHEILLNTMLYRALWLEYLREKGGEHNELVKRKD